MTRVIKTEYPPIKMVVEGTRLVPISQYDAERIDSYRRGTTLNVFITHEKQRVDEKRWWAAINRAVKECKTPWKTAVQASEAIKLAIGVINYSKTVSGSFMQYPKSLTELDDTELADAVRDLYDVLFGVTGVDPAEWKRHGAEIQEDPDTSAPSPADVSGDSAIPPPGTVAATEPAAADPEAGAGAPEEQDGPVSAPAPATDDLADCRECIAKLMGVARDKDVPDPKDRVAILADAAERWQGILADDRKDFVHAVFGMAKKVIKGELTEAKATEYLDGLL